MKVEKKKREAPQEEGGETEKRRNFVSIFLPSQELTHKTNHHQSQI
jgi:hypothetical protein